MTSASLELRDRSKVMQNFIDYQNSNKISEEKVM